MSWWDGTVRLYFDGAHLRHLIKRLSNESGFKGFLKPYNILDRNFTPENASAVAHLTREVAIRLGLHVQKQHALERPRFAFDFFDCDPPPKRNSNAKYDNLHEVLSELGFHLHKGKLVSRESCWHEDMTFLANRFTRACDQHNCRNPSSETGSGRIRRSMLQRRLLESLTTWAGSIRSTVTSMCGETSTASDSGEIPCPELGLELGFAERMLWARILDKKKTDEELLHHMQKGVDVQLAVKMTVDMITGNSPDVRKEQETERSKQTFGVLVADDDDFTPAAKQIHSYFSQRPTDYTRKPRLFLATISRSEEEPKRKRVESLVKAFHPGERLMIDEILQQLAHEGWDGFR